MKLVRSDILRLVRRSFEAFFSNRRLVLITICVLILVLLLYPRLFSGTSKLQAPGASFMCLEEALQEYTASNHDGLTVVSMPNPVGEDEKSKFIVPFVGNGYFGIDVVQNTLMIRQGRSLSLSVTAVKPLLLVEVLSLPSRPAVAYVIRYADGVVTRVESYATPSSRCFTISTRIFAHRVTPTLLVQHVSIGNPSGEEHSLRFVRQDPTRWSDVTTVTIPTTSSGLEHRLYTSTLDAKHDLDDESSPPSGTVVSITYGVPDLDSKEMKVQDTAKSFYSISALDFSEPAKSDVSSNYRNILEKSATKALTFALAGDNQSNGDAKAVERIQQSRLDDAHEKVWQQHYSAGFSLSHSFAPDVLNSAQINATLYYVIASSLAPVHEAEVDPETRAAATRSLANVRLCYNAHNTLLYPSKLWPPVILNVHDIAEVVARWKLTLDKRGCSDLMSAGADGVIQAMLLSFGGFKFTEGHLEFDMQADELHREFHFHGIQYGSNTSTVDVRVLLGNDNRASLLVTARTAPSDQVLYACDAGCLDPPVRLSSLPTRLPVKQTQPVSPILYVAAGQGHIKQLSDAIHVRHVVEAPAHDHHVIALHKHGHHLGGLPLMFWLGLAGLVFAFHAYLFKIVYDEYCKRSDAAEVLAKRGLRIGRYAV